MSDHHHHPHSHGHHEHHEHHEREPLPRNHGGLLYLDAFSGLAGDMIVAALLDLGVPVSELTAGLSGLGLSGYELVHSRVFRSSLAGRHFDVQLSAAQPGRDYAQIRALLTAADSLTPGARALALAAFAKLAHAEAEVHACAVEDVHFHEVGAVDSIVDIVCAAIAFDYLGAEVVCSPLPLGRGSTRSAHGIIPLPAPATVLCLRGIPTYDAGLAAELVTPTGACLVATIAREFGAWPAFRPERVGVGAGTKEWPDRPNLLRVILGEATSPEALRRSHGRHVVIETNVDDMTPEVAAYALQRALAAGALDAWTTAIGMKKGRSASQLSVLCKHDDLDALAKLLLTETSSIGLRHYTVDRIERPRTIVTVETPYGPLDIKVASGDGLESQVSPEYETCRKAAEVHQVSMRTVYAAALRAFETVRTKT